MKFSRIITNFKQPSSVVALCFKMESESAASAQSAKARPMAIPKHVGQEDPAIMSFSPTKMTSQTIDRFNLEESQGVPLQTAWTFWIDKAMHNATVNEYKANIKRIYTVSTVQGFWSVYKHIPDVRYFTKLLPILIYCFYAYHSCRNLERPSERLVLSRILLLTCVT